MSSLSLPNILDPTISTPYINSHPNVPVIHLQASNDTILLEGEIVEMLRRR